MNFTSSKKMKRLIKLHNNDVLTQVEDLYIDEKYDEAVSINIT